MPYKFNPFTGDFDYYESGTGGGAHNDLTGRSDADAHPTSAVTGLDSALSGKQPLDQDLTDISALAGDGFPKRTSGVWSMDAGGGGGGTTIYKGSAVLDFGAFPGSNEASVTVTGQTGILSGSHVEARFVASASSDHTASDHAYAPFLVGLTTGAIVAGTGFTVYGRSPEKMQGTFNVQWAWN